MGTTTLSTVLIPFAIALVLAYLANPFIDFIQYRLKVRHRIASVLIGSTALIGLTFAALVVVVPIIINEIERFWKLISKYGNEEKRRELISESMEGRIREFFTSEQFLSLFTEEKLTQAIEKMLPEIWDFFTGSVNLLIGLLAFSIVILYLIFILIDYQQIKEGWKNLLPPKVKPQVIEVVEDLEEGMSRYFRAQALIAFLVGILFATGFQIIGLPLGIFLGLFVGFLNLVPYLQTIGIFPAIFLAALKSMETGQSFFVILGLVILVFAVVQAIQDGILVPKIMGDTTGLKPAVILLALSIWGVLLGFIGLIIALPLTTVLLSYYKRFISQPASGQSVPDSIPPTD
jgi:predicted PurR-regulated permease PerM